MPPSAHVRSPAHTPDELHAIIQDAINRADLDAFLDAHDDDATIVIPPDGRSARGRDELLNRGPACAVRRREER